uniref:Uncharacterized protein n=2 Tax=Wuchereria bancrofti TaxID=6293 RepID=A0A1I8ELP9_WUCBA
MARKKGKAWRAKRRKISRKNSARKSNEPCSSKSSGPRSSGPKPSGLRLTDPKRSDPELSDQESSESESSEPESSDSESSDSEQPGPSETTDPKPPEPGPSTSTVAVDSDNKPPEKSPEEQRREITRKFCEVLMSTLSIFNFGEKNNIPTEVLMLIFIKGRWRANSEILLPSWVKHYNKFGRIDGPGFNYMRRDFRIIRIEVSANIKRLIKKFPFGCEEENETTSENKETEQNESNQEKDEKTEETNAKEEVIIEQSTSMENVTSEEPNSIQNVTNEESSLAENVTNEESSSAENVTNEESSSAENVTDEESSSNENEENQESESKTDEEDKDKEDSEVSSDEDDDSCNMPATLLAELRQDYVKESAAANIALEIICMSKTLIRLFIFEKHQMVTEWEMAKEAYVLRTLDWRLAPGMKILCDEIAKEMIEIDKALEAILCLVRYEMASNLMKRLEVGE